MMLRDELYIGILRAALALVMVSGCASPPLTLPTTLEKTPVKVALPGKAQLMLSQEITGNANKCRQLADDLGVVLKRDGQKADVSLSPACVNPKQLTLTTVGYVPKGEYRISLNRRATRYFKGDPKVLARYENADFNSGTDYLPDGAAPLEANQQVKGTVNYNLGDRTDWIRIKGKETNVQLTLVLGEASQELKATVFWYSESHNEPQSLGPLVPGKKRTVRLEQDDMYVRIQANEFSDISDYTLLRRDGSGTKKQSIAVLDCFGVSDASSVILLQMADGLKVSDKILISGKTAAGKLRPIGKCEITSISEERANCRLDRPYSSEIVEYRAEGKGA